jgi:hypothetical protein
MFPLEFELVVAALEEDGALQADRPTLHTSIGNQPYCTKRKNLFGNEFMFNCPRVACKLSSQAMGTWPQRVVFMSIR